MSTIYVTGPCLIYVGIPTSIATIIGALVTSSTLQGGFGGVGGAALQAGVGVGLGAAGLTSVGPANFSSVPGPATDFLLGVLRLVTPLYLGTCEDTPTVEFDPAYVPLPRDETGSTHPWARLYDGEEATIVADLTAYNELVYAMLAAKAASAFSNIPTAPRGIDLDGYVGTLMEPEGGTVPLWLFWPYAAKPLMGLQGMPAGYRFFSTLLLNDSLGPMSTRPRKLRLAWRATRLLAPSIGTFLYDHNMFGLPPPN